MEISPSREHFIVPGRRRHVQGEGYLPLVKMQYSVEPASEAQYHPFVIRRLYVHNFRCLENFELPISGHSSVLLIGKNGSGKTTVGLALEIFQKIARGTNRVGDLVKPKDFARGRADVPMRFEIEAELEGDIYEYVIAFEFPDGFKELRALERKIELVEFFGVDLPQSFKELRVFEEKLAVGGKPVYTREGAQVSLTRTGERMDATFSIDWHLVALPIVQERSRTDPLFIFKQWLARMLILRPTPGLILGDSQEETLQPNVQVTNFGAWFSGLLAHAPSAYYKIDEYLKQIMPDLKDIQNPATGTNSRSLVVQFSNGRGSLALPFGDLADGEKCFMICALALAANDAYGPVLCFWDEPDNYLAPSEVGHFVLALRKAFQSSGQFIATSHNPEAIYRFSEENTILLYRNGHLEPALVRPLSELQSTATFSARWSVAIWNRDGKPESATPVSAA
jgi:ABC-type cobalamin/Fe3+-siderophores transport system ATPase subunit